MAEIAAPSLARLQASLTRDGFAFMQAAAMRAVLAQAGSLADWDKFAASWDDLEIDTYMAIRGRYRNPRHAVSPARHGASGSAILRQPHQPHFQTLEYNPLHGDI